MTKTIPIIFSSEMIRAILAERKNQTRRVAPITNISIQEIGNGLNSINVDFSIPVKKALRVGTGGPFSRDELMKWFVNNYANHKPGDVLWVKEAAWMWCEKRPNGVTKTGRPKFHYVPLEYAPIRYVADNPEKPATAVVSPDTGNEWGWRFKTARFMPRWASRITLEVVSVRVERLQDISEEDAEAEGIECFDPENDASVCRMPGTEDWDYQFARDVFRDLWDKINGEKHPWERNECVRVIEFKQIEEGKNG